jgi:hypothetical protein
MMSPGIDDSDDDEYEPAEQALALPGAVEARLLRPRPHPLAPAPPVNPLTTFEAPDSFATLVHLQALAAAAARAAWAEAEPPRSPRARASSPARGGHGGDGGDGDSGSDDDGGYADGWSDSEDETMQGGDGDSVASDGDDDMGVAALAAGAAPAGSGFPASRRLTIASGRRRTLDVSAAVAAERMLEPLDVGTDTLGRAATGSKRRRDATESPSRAAPLASPAAPLAAGGPARRSSGVGVAGAAKRPKWMGAGDSLGEGW